MLLVPSMSPVKVFLMKARPSLGPSACDSISDGSQPVISNFASMRVLISSVWR